MPAVELAYPARVLRSMPRDKGLHIGALLRRRGAGNLLSLSNKVVVVLSHLRRFCPAISRSMAIRAARSAEIA